MNSENGRVIWITGLSGAGKTTLSKALIGLLKEKNVCCVHLDGDKIREVLGKDSISNENHSREARLALAMTYSRLAKLLADQGTLVIVSTVSMFKEIYTWNRNNLTQYFEVYLDIPLNELKLRDPKNIYGQFSDGKIKNVAGLDLPIDEPQQAHLKITYNNTLSPAKCAALIMEKIQDPK